MIFKLTQTDVYDIGTVRSSFEVVAYSEEQAEVLIKRHLSRIFRNFPAGQVVAQYWGVDSQPLSAGPDIFGSPNNWIQPGNSWTPQEPLQGQGQVAFTNVGPGVLQPGQMVVFTADMPVISLTNANGVSTVLSVTRKE
jgi:hypothetical protein